MRWLKRLLPSLLVIAALVVALGVFFSDHSDDYGRAPLAGGAAVSLPAGEVLVFVDEPGRSSEQRLLSGPLRLQVRPAGGGAALEQHATAKYGDGSIQTERSQEVGKKGSVVAIEVPRAGSYVATGRIGNAPGSTGELSFGTDSFAAVGERWRLFAVLIAVAAAIALAPVPPRRRERWQDRDWSAEPNAPEAVLYSGPPPYQG